MLDGSLPVNHAILGNLQDVFNLLPNLSTPKVSDGTPGVEHTDLARAMSIKTNDQLMSIYLSSLIRSITAFHDLIENKIQNKQQREDREQKQEDDKLDNKIKKEEKLMLNGDGGNTTSDGAKSAEKDTTDEGKK